MFRMTTSRLFIAAALFLSSSSSSITSAAQTSRQEKGDKYGTYLRSTDDSVMASDRKLSIIEDVEGTERMISSNTWCSAIYRTRWEKDSDAWFTSRSWQNGDSYFCAQVNASDGSCDDLKERYYDKGDDSDNPCPSDDHVCIDTGLEWAYSGWCFGCNNWFRNYRQIKRDNTYDELEGVSCSQLSIGGACTFEKYDGHTDPNDNSSPDLMIFKCE